MLIVTYCLVNVQFKFSFTWDNRINYKIVIINGCNNASSSGKMAIQAMLTIVDEFHST